MASQPILSTCEAAECMDWCGEVWCPCVWWRWGGWELWCPWFCWWWWLLCAWPGWWWWAWCGYPWGGPCMCWWGCRWWWPLCSCRDDIISIMWPMEFMLPFDMPPGWWARAAFSLWVENRGKVYINVMTSTFHIFHVLLLSLLSQLHKKTFWTCTRKNDWIFNIYIMIVFCLVSQKKWKSLNKIDLLAKQNTLKHWIYLFIFIYTSRFFSYTSLGD